MRKALAILIATVYLLNFIVIIGIAGGIEKNLIPERTGFFWIAIFLVVQLLDTWIINIVDRFIEEDEKDD